MKKKRSFQKKFQKISLKQLKKQFNISTQLNYKNILLLRNYITISGKMFPKRLNGLTAFQQRHLSKAIKNARILSLLPFVRLIDT